MSDDLKNEKDRESASPFPPTSTEEFTKAMRAIVREHEEQRRKERHDANSAQQKAVGIISQEQLILSGKVQEIAETQRVQEEAIRSLDRKIDGLLEIAVSNGKTTVNAAVKAEAAAKTSKSTFLEQRAIIVTGLGTAAYWLIEYFLKK